MSLPERIATILAPHLGELSADTVARHVCAKYELSDSASPQQMEQLTEFLRRGLVAYVGADKAKELSAECAKVTKTA